MISLFLIAIIGYYFYVILTIYCKQEYSMFDFIPFFMIVKTIISGIKRKFSANISV